MSFYIGPVYINDGDIFLFLAVVVALACLIFHIPLPFLDAQSLLFLLFLFLVARWLVLPAQTPTLYILFLTAVLAAVTYPFSTVFLYVLISFLLLRLTHQL